MPEFCHLHCHTQYSLLDGAAAIESLISKAADLEIPALAITDHGNLFGVPEFYKTAKRYGVQPIIGCEFYLTPTTMSDRTDRTRYHQVLLAKNAVGYRNLIKLSSLSYTDGYYYKPRIDIETLRAHHEGLVATTCCLQGHVPRTILDKGEEEAKKVFETYLDIFGEDYYVEIQDHGITDQKICNTVLLAFAKEYGVKTLATNDVHYVEEADAEAQDVLLCLQTGKDYSDPNRMRFENNQFFLKGIDGMRAALQGLEPGIRDESLDFTREVADKCRFDLPMGELLMPHFPIPEEFRNNANDYLRHLVYERAPIRYPEMPQDVSERLDHELQIIRQMDYAGYFLIVQDFTTEARRLGVRVGPGRGSAAGSCVAYCLGITDIDPLKYDLLFERFLNPERVSMPDIDIDFDDRGRAKVIDYVIEKYGRKNVCQIITFGSMGARSVIRDVSRVLKIPLAEADRIAKLIPDGPKVDLKTAQKKIKEFADLQSSADRSIRDLMRYSTVLEGSPRHTGVHAAGIIIAPGELSDYVPIATAKSKAGSDETVVTTQYDGRWVEEFGLLKMDFLGLRTLTILEDALELIQQRHDLKIDLDAIPLDDPETLRLFQRGETVAVFQFESSGMREWLRKLRPDAFNDLIAMNALYRPGPMDNIPDYIDRKHGNRKVVYPHPLLEEILQTTYGIPVYQEQVMQIAQEMGGYSLGSADLLRRAMGKKKQSEMDKQEQQFLDGAAEKGVPKETAKEVFDLMAKFAGYGFNKSHSAAYSLVAFQTAYLKVHYPAEYMAAVMTAEMNDIKKLQIALDEARRMGISIDAPDVNVSQANFSVDGQRIVFGLAAIKGVGHGAIEAIVAERNDNGPFESLVDLCSRVDYRSVNKKALESMIKAGALDSLPGHRAQLLFAVEDAIRFGQKIQFDKAAGQNSLFGAVSGNGTSLIPPLPEIAPWPTTQRLRYERELMGIYVSGHPLDEYHAVVKALATAELADVQDLKEDSEYVFAGILTSVRRTITKSGRAMAFAELEDFDGAAELVIFSSTFEKLQPILVEDNLVMIRGNAETKTGKLKIKVREMWTLSSVQERAIESIILNIDLDQETDESVNSLYDFCDAHRGKCKLYFDVSSGRLPSPVRLRSRQVLVDPSPVMMRWLYLNFGKDNVKIDGRL